MASTAPTLVPAAKPRPRTRSVPSPRHSKCRSRNSKECHSTRRSCSEVAKQGLTILSARPPPPTRRPSFGTSRLSSGTSCHLGNSTARHHQRSGLIPRQRVLCAPRTRDPSSSDCARSASRGVDALPCRLRPHRRRRCVARHPGPDTTPLHPGPLRLRIPPNCGASIPRAQPSEPPSAEP
jgi:hypothetical protein